MTFKPSDYKVNGGSAWISDTGILCICNKHRTSCSISKEDDWPVMPEIFEVAEKLLHATAFIMFADKKQQQINLIKR